MAVPSPSAASARRLSSLHCSTSYSTHGDGNTAFQTPLQQRHIRGRQWLTTTSAARQRPQQRLEQATSDRGSRRRGDAVVVAADAAGFAAMSTSIDMSRRGCTSCLAPAPTRNPRLILSVAMCCQEPEAAASPSAQRVYDDCCERLICVMLHAGLLIYSRAQRLHKPLISAQ